ncbi:MAG: bifunctional adenosylcobinamide kinase/adenosylcobinamide-phosphate guanylyltransferase [Acidimicrobiales bacterium]|nr:bifunctional adenosylcobinamide kinase/adenosylcobinamide-phosphate guanylyltransferase [Acidimicrobiales bacterium]MYD34502.1 bifunctional adenosylcobinamide kinase/adenosylcobinamide-phosphate guanylyltransferase [Acidimicrobiales bacterium]MYI09858.1 bifunctional adenosylcobinamide kinase/adenosylcobinamide-phosphate guanylyltransferase [Acidimicrobiales bacterium]
MLIAFTGGARSGKSTGALRAAASAGATVTFIATAEAGDDEMAARIERHRAERPAAWTTIEAPIHLALAVDQVDAEATIVIDCLSMWVSNRMLAGGAAEAEDCARSIVAEAGDLGERLRERRGTAVVVTNEVGSGIVPATSLGRAYRDVLGSVNQAIFASADRAFLVVAGRLLELQDPSDGV